nr:DMT family transporter [Microbacterium ginsengiterrae]
MIGIALAIASAIALSGGNLLQAKGVRRMQHSSAPGLMAKAAQLLRNRVWLIGAVLLGVSIILQMGSLGFAPLIVVQPVGVTALVFTVVLTALIAKRRPSAAVIRAIATCVLGVAAFVTVAALVSTQTAITDQQLIAVLVVLGSVLLVTAIVMVVGRRRTTPPVMWVLLGGIYSAFVATLGKTVILRVQTAWKHHDLTLDDKNLLTIGCLIGIGVAGGLSIYFVQRAHAFNKPEVVVAGLTVIDPAIAVVLGITILGEANNAPALSIVAFIVAGAVAVTGVFQLSRAEQAEPALD